MSTLPTQSAPVKSETIRLSPEEIVLINLLREINKEKKIGVVGCRLLNTDKTTQFSIGYFPNLPKIFFWMTFIDDIPILSDIIKPYHLQIPSHYEKKRDVDWVSGACFLIRKETINIIGLLDEKIFMYVEEVELCYRINKKGYKVFYTPHSQLTHSKGASSSTKSEAGLIEEFKGLIYFYNKHKPGWQLPVLKGLIICGILLRIVVFGIIGRYPQRISLYAKILKMVG